MGCSSVEDRDEFVHNIGGLLVAAVRYADNWNQFFSSFDDYIRAGTAEYLCLACKFFSAPALKNAALLGAHYHSCCQAANPCTAYPTAKGKTNIIFGKG